MSNDLIDMQAFAGKVPAQAFREPGEVESLAEGIGSSYGIIGYKGKVWTLRLRGEKHTFVRPDDGTPAGHIDVIILKQAKAKSKSYYEKYDPNSSEGMRPICASLDGIVPDEDAVNKQSTACAICPKNAWKTAADGSKSRECTDYKRLAVLLLPSVTQQMLGSQLMEPVFLRVPPASLNNLAIYGEQMKKQGWPYHSVVTRVTFDPNQPHPKMVFRGIQALTDAEAPVILPLRTDHQTLRITGDDKVPHEAIRPLPQASIGLVPPPAQPATVVVQAPAAPPPAPAPQPMNLGFGAPTVTAPLAPPPPVGGILDLQANPPPPIAAAPAPQTTADTGEPTEADAAMSAHVAELLKSVTAAA